MKPLFFDTQFATLAGLSTQMPRVLRYAVENKNAVFSAIELAALVQPIRTILKTPTAEFFDRLVAADQLPYFSAINITTKDSSVPELLTSTSITLDLKYAPGAQALSSIPEYKDKCLVNITSVIRPDKVSGGYLINAVDTFQNLIVRSSLCMSYHDRPWDWISASLAEFCAKSYSMILSGIISRYYNLSLTETLKIAGIFALYFTQMLDVDNKAMPGYFNRCTFIGSRLELQEIAKFCESQSTSGLNLKKVCQLAVEMGPEKMKNFNPASLLALAGNLGPDYITSQIALEYPPYWVFMMLLALSGAKIPLIFQMNQQKLTAEGRTKFLQHLLTCQSLFDVRR